MEQVSTRNRIEWTSSNHLLCLTLTFLHLLELQDHSLDFLNSNGRVLSMRQHGAAVTTQALIGLTLRCEAHVARAVHRAIHHDHTALAIAHQFLVSTLR